MQRTNGQALTATRLLHVVAGSPGDSVTIPSPAPNAPRSVGAAAEAVVAARGQPERLARVFDRSPVPMVMADDGRRYVEVNRPARLTFRLSLAEMRRLRIEDLTPPELLTALDPIWERLVRTGCIAGPWTIQGPDGGRLDIVYYGLSDALPGLHVIAFVPAGWTEADLGLADDEAPEPATLTPRELDLLQLAAQGLNGPQIADDLVVSMATVKTHFENIYSKLGVPDRVAAVASAMRLGLID
ncbi:MAG: two-component system, NarL family, nitrate/nitrite response regulator NarL [Solirubrobacteraceae bacterium]|nr:two-component system, NarL family, nitrate/nitrite response regulator NarL [Solirubrobacteraceae bacterium]